MKTFNKGDKVIVKPMLNEPVPDEVTKNFTLSGQVGYVREPINKGLLWVVLPEHRFYSTGRGALLRPSEIELA